MSGANVQSAVLHLQKGWCKMKPKRLAIVMPCYNEEAMLPLTIEMIGKKLSELKDSNLCDAESFVLFVNDGSKDKTWDIIKEACQKDPSFKGVCLSRNRGHQNALLAGLFTAKEMADIVVSCDCDGQDDINAIDEMIRKSNDGSEIVYGVRRQRAKDTWFKRFTAEPFYKLISILGGEIVFNHADYRLASSRVLNELEQFGEVNLFLRGMFPMLGFKNDIVYYDREERVAGESHYPFAKMLSFAIDGITSLSVRPLRMIMGLGILTAITGVAMILWCLISFVRGVVVPGWASTVMIVCIFCGVQSISLGVIGEYVGKIYLETKKRPRYIISEKVG